MNTSTPFEDPRWQSLRKVAASAARGDISELLRGAERGDRVVITRNGKPVVAVVPLTDLALLLHEDREAEREIMRRIAGRGLSIDENTIDLDEVMDCMEEESSPAGIDGLQLLAQDHRVVEELFARFEQASGTSAKEKIVREICTELKIHARIEEEIYYPAIRGKVEDADLDEAYVEHDSAKLLINELEAAEPDESFYDAKVKVLSELIEHHVKEEEKQRDNLFQQTRAADIDLEALGAQLAARKAQLKEEAERGRLAPAASVTLRRARSLSAA